MGPQAPRAAPQRFFPLHRVWDAAFKGTLVGTPNREPQEYSKNIMEYKDPGSYVPAIFLLYSWSSLFGVPIKVPLAFSLGKYRVGTLTFGLNTKP